jgi:hypothetical protein
MTLRRWALPVLVIWPRTIRFLLECLLETAPLPFHRSSVEDIPLKAECIRQRKYRVDDLELWVLGSPGEGRQFCDALDGNIGEAGKNSSQVVACR